MATRKAAIFVATVVLLTVIPIAVIAGGGTALDSQAFRLGTPQSSTSSGNYRNIPGMGNTTLCTTSSRMSVLVSLTLAGEPADVRVMIDGVPSDSGVAQFDPTATSKSFSYDFVEFEPGAGPHDIDVQWRSRTGDEVTLRRGQPIYLFEAQPCS